MNELVVASSIQEALAANPRAGGIRLSTEGFTLPQKARLVYYSRNPKYEGHQAIADNTSDPVRFGSIPAVTEWINKGRTQVHFEPGGNDIFGLFWEGEEAFPLEYKNVHGVKVPKTLINGFTRADAEKCDITYAARMYGRGHGKGLSKLGTVAVRDVYRQTSTYAEQSRKGKGKDWLEVSTANPIAIRSYESSGAVVVTEPYVVVDKYTDIPHEKINMVFPEFRPFGSNEPDVLIFDMHSGSAA